MLTKTTAALALCLSLGLGGAALAQSYGEDGGEDAATAPGGTEGAAGAANVREAIRDGEAVGVPPGAIIEERRLPPGARPRRPAEPR